MTSPRAIRYRRLALVEQDNEKAQLLRQIADEADRGVLFTVEHSRHDKIEIPIKSGDGKKMTEIARKPIVGKLVDGKKCWRTSAAASCKNLVRQP
jgi:hypothetical protein